MQSVLRLTAILTNKFLLDDCNSDSTTIIYRHTTTGTRLDLTCLRHSFLLVFSVKVRNE